MTDNAITGKTVDAHIENPDQASTNYYWSYETVNGIFNFQTTIRGILTPEQIHAHIKSALESNAHIISLGGVARGAGRDGNPNASDMPKPTPVDQIITDAVNADPMWNQPEAPSATSTSSTAEPSDDTFITELLVCNISDGKKFFKIKGGKWSRWGVTAWDEVLTAAGIPVGKLEGKEYKLEGYRATFIRKEDGNPKKVVKLEKI